MEGVVAHKELHDMFVELDVHVLEKEFDGPLCAVNCISLKRIDSHQLKARLENIHGLTRAQFQVVVRPLLIA